MPHAHALAEDYLLEEVAPGKTHPSHKHRAAYAARVGPPDNRRCTSTKYARALASTCRLIGPRKLD